MQAKPFIEIWVVANRMLAYRLGMQLNELNNSYIEKERNTIKQQGQMEALIFSFSPGGGNGATR